MAFFNKSVGRRIWEIREKCEYSREKLAELADINSGFLYEIETGRKGMSAHTIYRLARSLDTTTDHLICGNPDDKKFGIIIGLLRDLNDDEIKHTENIIRDIIKFRSTVRNNSQT